MSAAVGERNSRAFATQRDHSLKIPISQSAKVESGGDYIPPRTTVHHLRNNYLSVGSGTVSHFNGGGIHQQGRSICCLDVIIDGESTQQSTNLLSAVSDRRRRNLQVKRRVVLSPGKDQPEEYLDLERQDDTKRLKRIFFETYLESSKQSEALQSEHTVSQTIFERDESPSEAIEKRKLDKIMKIREDPEHNGKLINRSICGDPEEFIQYKEKKRQEERQRLLSQQQRTLTKAQKTMSRRLTNQSLGTQNYDKQVSKKITSSNRLGFQIDQGNQKVYTASYGERVESPSEQNEHSQLYSRQTTNRLLRSLQFSRPISPARQEKAEILYNKSNRIWDATAKYFKDKIKQETSLIQTQSNYSVTREEFFTPTNSNHQKPVFMARKGKSRDLPDEVRSFYQSLRYGKEGCGFVYEPSSPKNTYTSLWAIQLSPNKIQSQFKKELLKALTVNSSQATQNQLLKYAADHQGFSAMADKRGRNHNSNKPNAL